MYYPVCGMMHIKEPLLLIGKSSLSEWSFTICLTPYKRKLNVLSASLNKTFPSFLHHFSYFIHIKVVVNLLLVHDLTSYYKAVFVDQTVYVSSK